jgi:serine-type D-Ala-D-Ala carboxypeptidase/endopeptidase (penicillin-binding protein 4)
VSFPLRFLLAAALSAIDPGLAGATALPPEVTRLLARAGVPDSAVSVLVEPLVAAGAPAGTPRIQHQPDAVFHPASVMKLVTTYAGLDLLGADFRWRNRVYYDGFVVNGVLDGHLVIRGSGDPKLVLERIDALLREVIARGVHEIRGDIVLDRSVFVVPERNPADFDGEPLRPYNVSPDGLLLNFQSLLLRFSPDPARGVARVDSEPPMADLEVPAQVPLTPGPCEDWRTRLRADFSAPDRIAFAGRYARACGEQIWPVAYVDPRGYAPRVIRALWQRAGGLLGGRVREGHTPPTARLLLEADSLPLADIAADINKFSNNVMAQQLFLTLGLPPRGPAHFEAARERLRQWWTQRLGAYPPPEIDNGSGLSRTERLRARSLAALLQLAARSPVSTAFTDSLSIAGVDGTTARLRERRPDSPAIGNARLKTGSLRDVASVAGYATGLSGQRYLLVAMVNHDNAAAARPALEHLVEWVIQDTPGARTVTLPRCAARNGAACRARD